MRMIPLRKFRKSSFPPLVMKSLRDLLSKKKQGHKMYENFGGANRFCKFSLLRARCKSEMKLLCRNYMHTIQEQLRSFSRFGILSAIAKKVIPFPRKFIQETHQLDSLATTRESRPDGIAALLLYCCHDILSSLVCLVFNK